MIWWIIYILAVSYISGLLCEAGYGLRDWEWWIALTFILLARMSGYYSGVSNK